MNREEIINLSVQAGNDWDSLLREDQETLMRFGALVAAKERERCALIVELEASQYTEPVWALEIVNDIRDGILPRAEWINKQQNDD